MVSRSEVSQEERSVIAQDFADVRPGFIKWWKRAVPVHGMFSRVIGRQGKWQVPAKSVQQLPEVFRASADVVLRIVQISDLQPDGSLRYELHQPLPDARHRVRIEVRFGFDDSPERVPNAVDAGVKTS